MIKCVFDSPCHYNAHCRDGGNAVACVCRLVCHNFFLFFPPIIDLAALNTIFNIRAAVASCKYSTRVCLDLNQSTMGLRLKDVGSSSHHVGSSSRALLGYEAVLQWFRTSDVVIAAISVVSGFVDMSSPLPAVQGIGEGFVPYLLFPMEQETWKNYQTRSS